MGQAAELITAGAAKNYGVYFTGATLTAGNGGTPANTINVTGIGGTGAGGIHIGMQIDQLRRWVNINLNGTSTYNAINFSNSVGGTGTAAITSE